jgi:hypothetical protein
MSFSTQPFSSPGRFWRGNLHTHSNRSDGRLSPEEVCNFYREANYDFLSITDHFMECYDFPIADTRPYNTPDFITIAGAELHTGETEFGQLWHILAVGLPSNFAPNRPGETGPQITARALASGAFVAAAHPAWYGATEQDIRSLGAIHAIEIYNGCAADHNDRAESWYVLDQMLTRGARYTACATDDAHFHPDRHGELRGWVYVKCEALQPEVILEALKAGEYYSSSGPQLHSVQLVTGNKLRISCSPVDRVWIVGGCGGNAVACAHGNGLIEAELNLKILSGSPYFRITVRDRDGAHAWSNPIWL